jgi:hypothetical protein
VVSAILFVLMLLPLSCGGFALGDMNKIGEGFGTFDYDEVVKKGTEYHVKEKIENYRETIREGANHEEIEVEILDASDKDKS